MNDAWTLASTSGIVVRLEDFGEIHMGARHLRIGDALLLLSFDFADGRVRHHAPTPARGTRATAQASVSAQMFFAQAIAVIASRRFLEADKPPAPGTGKKVRLSLSNWCTDATCTTSSALTKL